ncbi:TPA: phage tail protein [Streptococcus pyogenes]|uniref:phage tail tube protein n=1 Tax=Streptococcus dysgalactiae TaxID=1334 RepID=UPI00133041F9|nr:phage tail protein [Streptococcus dysgalactiae]HEP3892200.1 phage tail protein [Streptococcus pyogenes]HEP4661147.1 phage tail protein [Streptococcus pyogenes]HEP4713285.1 phage tail protein [Streptococcus pyogenes]HEP4777203.1 phage tail protein [Streptococcus pyogenes]HEQ1523682.1 phage tail protein [Streptococcus pyogenes]
MARQKNALRGHFIAPYVKGEKTEVAKDKFLELAKWIKDISDDTDEKTEDEAYYDGDGTEETTVVGVKGAYTFEGTYDPDDEAQKHIADMKYKTGDGRKVWHLIVSADGKKQWLGVATVTEIIAGSGAASDFEAFGCKITYNTLPEESTTLILDKKENSFEM